MILPIITLLSITGATEGSCPKNVSTVTLELQHEIFDALNKSISTSDMKELQCAEVESKWINLRVWTLHLYYIIIIHRNPILFRILRTWSSSKEISYHVYILRLLLVYSKLFNRAKKVCLINTLNMHIWWLSLADSQLLKAIYPVTNYRLTFEMKCIILILCT